MIQIYILIFTLIILFLVIYKFLNKENFTELVCSDYNNLQDSGASDTLKIQALCNRDEKCKYDGGQCTNNNTECIPADPSNAEIDELGADKTNPGKLYDLCIDKNTETDNCTKTDVTLISRCQKFVLDTLNTSSSQDVIADPGTNYNTIKPAMVTDLKNNSSELVSELTNLFDTSSTDSSKLKEIKTNIDNTYNTLEDKLRSGLITDESSSDFHRKYLKKLENIFANKENDKDELLKKIIEKKISRLSRLKNSILKNPQTAINIRDDETVFRSLRNIKVNKSLNIYPIIEEIEGEKFMRKEYQNDGRYAGLYAIHVIKGISDDRENRFLFYEERNSDKEPRYNLSSDSSDKTVTKAPNAPDDNSELPFNYMLTNGTVTTTDASSQDVDNLFYNISKDIDMDGINGILSTIKNKTSPNKLNLSDNSVVKAKHNSGMFFKLLKINSDDEYNAVIDKIDDNAIRNDADYVSSLSRNNRCKPTDENIIYPFYLVIPYHKDNIHENKALCLVYTYPYSSNCNIDNTVSPILSVRPCRGEAEERFYASNTPVPIFEPC